MLLKNPGKMAQVGKPQLVANLRNGQAALFQQAGRLLHAHGLYERDATPQVRPQDSTLDLHHETGLKALMAAGLLEEFKQRHCPGADKMGTLNSQIEILLAENNQPLFLRFFTGSKANSTPSEIAN